MDLREIQALHAQYSSQPVTIDIAAQVAAMPALPAPEDEPTGRRFAALRAQATKFGRPTLIVVAIAAVAGLAGTAAANLWQSMRHWGAPAAAVAPGRMAQAARPASASAEMPIDVAPARPLTAADFNRTPGAPASALSNVDASTLAARAAQPRPADTQTKTAAASGDAERAIMSPIRPTVKTAAAAATAAPTGGAEQPTVSSATSKAATQSDAPRTPAKASVQVEAPKAPTETTRVASAATTAPTAKPASRPAHHVTHRALATSGAAPDQPAAAKAAPTAAAPANAPAKSGDVQLF